MPITLTKEEKTWLATTFRNDFDNIIKDSTRVIKGPGGKEVTIAVPKKGSQKKWVHNTVLDRFIAQWRPDANREEALEVGIFML